MIGATSLPITQLRGCIALLSYARQVSLLNTKVDDDFLHVRISCTIF